MSGKILIGAIACGAVLGSAAAAMAVPCMSGRNRKKIMRYKNRMMRKMGCVLDTINELRS